MADGNNFKNNCHLQLTSRPFGRQHLRMTEAQFLSSCPVEILLNCRDAVQRGFSDYAARYSHVADIHDNRTVASIIHCHIVEAAKSIACGPDLVFRYLAQRNLFILKNSVIIVFKKLDENLRSQNYPTRSATNFNAQEELEGIPANLPRIEVGYVPDSVGASIAGIYVVCRQGNQIDWSIDLHDDIEPRQRDLKIA